MHDVNPLCIAAQSSRFTSSHQVVGRRTESDRTADGIRQGVQLSQLHQQSRQAHSLGWCASYSVGALETSAPPKRRQHLCRSVKSVGLIPSKSEFRGSCYRGCSCLSCTNKADGESIPTEYAEHTEQSGGDVPPTDRHRCAQIRKVWHPCHTHATNRAND